MNENIYNWKKLEGKDYNIANNDVVLSTTCSMSFLNQFFDADLFKRFANEYSAVNIDHKVLEEIDLVLQQTKFLKYKNQFYLLVCIIQEQYVFYHEDKPDVRFGTSRDIASQTHDFSLLLDVLKNTMESGYSDMSSISFKSSNINLNNKTTTIKNIFVVKDILHAITSSFNVNAENFEIRKSELLDNRKDFDLQKGDENIKRKFVSDIVKMLSLKDGLETSSKNLRIAGTLLNICQIPIITRDFEVSTQPISVEEVKYLRNYVLRTE